MKTNRDTGLLILRLTIGILLLMHGLTKLSDLSFIKAVVSESGLPVFLSYGVYIGEIVAPIMLIVGFRTKIASLIIVFNMVVAVLMVHANQIFALSETGGWAIELQGLYIFSALALFFMGGGKYAVSTTNSWD